MFRNTEQLRCKLKPGIIAENSDYAWLIFLGEIPSYGKRLYSPFRRDRRPGCRWSYYNDQWYFIDNRGYDNKVVWSIFDFVGWQNPTLSKEEVYNLICYKLTSNIPNISKAVRRPDVAEIKKSNIIIKFEYEPWNEDNIFTQTLDIPPDYLNEEPCYLVTDYWCNSRRNNIVQKNPYHNPKKIPTIAYHFESNNVKLYWPTINKDTNKMRWYSNTNADDIFGEHRLNSYTDDYIAITKSGKDDLFLNYHYGLQTIATQNEAITQNTKIYNETRRFKRRWVWYDNDPTGIENGARLAGYVEGQAVYLGGSGKDPSGAFVEGENEDIYKIINRITQ